MMTAPNHSTPRKRGATDTPGAYRATDRLVRIAAHLLGVDETFKARLRISALRPPARLLVFIAVHRSISIKEAMLDSTLSYRAFYVMLNNLKAKALVNVERDRNDGRVRRIVLGANFAGFAKMLCELEL